VLGGPLSPSIQLSTWKVFKIAGGLQVLTGAFAAIAVVVYVVVQALSSRALPRSGRSGRWNTPPARLLRRVLRHLLTLSSPGVPFMTRRVEDVETMINNVSTYGAALKR